MPKGVVVRGVRCKLSEPDYIVHIFVLLRSIMICPLLKLTLSVQPNHSAIEIRFRVNILAGPPPLGTKGGWLKICLPPTEPLFRRLSGWGSSPDRGNDFVPPYQKRPASFTLSRIG